MWTRITRGRSSRASASSVPPGPESGTWPICRAVRPGDARGARARRRARTCRRRARRRSRRGGRARRRPSRARPGTYVSTPPVARSRKTSPLASTSAPGPGEVARRVAAGRERLDLERGAVERERAARLERPPLDAAVARRGSAARDSRRSGRGGRRRSRSTRIGVEDSRSSRRPAVWSISASVSRTPATGAARTPSAGSAGERLELLAQVRRGVGQEPRTVRAADRERRLRARPRGGARARGLARRAAAVPLREAAAGGRAEDANAHGRRTLPAPRPRARSGDRRRR